MIFDRVRGALFLMSDISWDSRATHFKELRNNPKKPHKNPDDRVRGALYPEPHIIRFKSHTFQRAPYMTFDTVRGYSDDPAKMGLFASPKSPISWYGVATVSRIDKIIGRFCRILSLLFGSFAKETYNFIDPTNQSHPTFQISYLIQGGENP